VAPHLPDPDATDETSPLPAEPELAQEESPPSPRATPAGALDLAIGELLGCDRDRAQVLVAELRLYHPRGIAQRIDLLYAGLDAVRPKARAVWAAGELCGAHGVEFLVRCAASPEFEVRRLAASALGKALAAVHDETTARASVLESARESLKRLLTDANPQVAQYAAKALASAGRG
jgi:hypothetical protein